MFKVKYINQDLFYNWTLIFKFKFILKEILENHKILDIKQFHFSFFYALILFLNPFISNRVNLIQRVNIERYSYASRFKILKTKVNIFPVKSVLTLVNSLSNSSTLLSPKSHVLLASCNLSTITIYYIYFIYEQIKNTVLNMILKTNSIYQYILSFLYVYTKRITMKNLTQKQNVIKKMCKHRKKHINP